MYEGIIRRLAYHESLAAWRQAYVLTAVGKRRTFATSSGGKSSETVVNDKSKNIVDENGSKSSSSENFGTNEESIPLSDSDRRQLIDRVLRVDHAGEFGADRIYAGQMAVLGKSSVGPVIKHMWEQEKHHLETMERLVVKHRVRPTLLMPFWNIAGFALGAGTALLGREGAMACTVAVEEVIGDHYNNQIRQLMADGGGQRHSELLGTLKKFRDEELEHHDTGLAHNAEQAVAYSALKFVIQTGCRTAIWISERI